MNHKQYRNKMKAQRKCAEEQRRRKDAARLDRLMKMAQAWMDELERNKYDIWGGKR